MSQESFEAAEAGLQALRRRDWEYLGRACHPDVVLVQPPELPGSKTYRGLDGIRRAAEEWPSQWAAFRLDLVEVIDVSDQQVIAVTRQRGRGAESGIETYFTVAYVLTGHDNKLARLEMFFSRGEALEAVGLSE